MTSETKKEVELAKYREFRCKAVLNLRAMGVPDVEDSWEGIMKAVDYVKGHANREGEFSGAVMAAAMWMHGYCEEQTACAVEKAMEMVDREVAVAVAGEAHADAGNDAAAETGKVSTPASAPVSK